jgi:hypothetical protein
MVRRLGFEEQFYPVIFKIYCALANYDILAGEGGSLRMQEGDEYGVMLTRICTKGKKAVENARKRMKRGNQRGRWSGKHKRGSIARRSLTQRRTSKGCLPPTRRHPGKNKLDPAQNLQPIWRIQGNPTFRAF